MAKILLIGDIMGRPGRLAAARVLPLWQQEHNPDVIIGNVENLAHGRGITENTIQEMNALGFDAYTSGNHVFETGPHAESCFEKWDNIIRPANYVGTYPGQGFYRFAKAGQQYLVLNFSGRVFMEGRDNKWNIANPFLVFDELFQAQTQKDDIIIVDLHAEATSEKQAFSWYLDGRATVVYGTHTHVPTADDRVLPKGTAHISDVGMTGALDSIIGVAPEAALPMFLEQGKFKTEIPESGPAVVNGFLVEVEQNKVTNFQRLQSKVNPETKS